MNVLIIGGTGFLGYHAALEFVRRGHQVTAVARRAPEKPLFPEGVRLHLSDVNALSEDERKALFQGYEAVVFAAGADVGAALPKPAYDYFYRENVLSCIRVFSAAQAVGVTRGVICGSYFNTLDRLHPEMRLSELNPYIRSRKAQAEESLKVAKPGLQLMILELPYIFGSMPGRKPLWASLVRYIRSPYPFIYPPGGTNAISVKNVAQAIAGAIEHGQGGERYPIGDENLTWRELWGRVARLAGHPKKVITLPAVLVRAGLGLVQLSVQVRGKEMGLAPYPFGKLLTSNAFFDPCPARAALGFEQGDLDQALEDTIRASV